MAGRNLTLSALRALDSRLQHLAGFVHRQVQQIEKRAELATPSAFDPPDPGQPQSRPEGPPAHWLERVRQAAPGFLEPDPATSGQASAWPFEFKAGSAAEEAVNPPENSKLVGEESPVEAKPVSSEHRHPVGLAPKFSFKNAYRANRSEKASSEGGEDSREGVSAAGKPETPSKRNFSQRARVVFPGYGPGRDARNSQTPQYKGSPDIPAIPVNSGVVNYSAGSPPREGRLNRLETHKEGEAPDSKLAGYSSSLPPKIFNSPKFDDVKDFGPTLQNKPAPNYSSDRKSLSSQPGNSSFQADLNPGQDYLPSRQGNNLKFGILPASKPQNPPEPNYPGINENNISQNRAYKREFPNEKIAKAPEYWSGGTEQENLFSRNNLKMSPFQNQVDINRSGADYRPWPELPEETPVENEAGQWQQVRRKMEHLRRLDEEQRGSYGAGSLFN